MPIIDSRSGVRGVLVDLDTGQRIPFARWCNTDTGEWEAFAPGPDGKQTKRVIRGRGRIHFVPGSGVKPRPNTPSASLSQQPAATATRQRILALSDRPCQAYGCSREATWKVADEQQLDPVEADGKKYDAAKLIGVRYYCEWHYDWPRLYDKKLELIENTIVKARPD